MSLTTTELTMPQGTISVVETSGAGMPVLLLHGLGTGKAVFEKQMQGPLGELHRLIAFDLPGHGESSDATDPARDYSLAALADLSAAILAKLGVERAVVFGWSLGGHIAIQMLVDHAPMVAGLMLTGAPPFSRTTVGTLRAFHLSREMLLARKETYSARDAARYERMCFGEAADGRYLPLILRSDGRFRPPVNRSLLRDAPDQRVIIEASDIPVAIVNGADEPVVRLGHLASIRYRNLWEGMTYVIPDAGHAPFVTAPHAFDAIFHRFVTHVALNEQQQAPAVNAPHRDEGRRYA